MVPNLIIAAILAGSSDKEKLFRKIYSDNYAVLINAINRRINNIHDSEEICHNLFISMYRKIDEIRDHASWLRSAMRLEILEYLRKNNRHQRAVSIDDLTDDMMPPAKSEFSDLSIVLAEVLKDDANFDSPRDRAIFELIGYNKYTYIEVARELGLSRRQVEYSYSKTAQKLLLSLKNKGINKEDFL